MTTPEEAAREHEWIKRSNLIVCKKCMIVKRADGKNAPCKGSAKLSLRGNDAVAQAFIWIAREAMQAEVAYLASTAREAKLREALENIEDIATTGRISELVEKFNTMKLIARAALADKEGE
jgi:hypothetical protein